MIPPIIIRLVSEAIDMNKEEAIRNEARKSLEEIKSYIESLVMVNA